MISLPPEKSVGHSKYNTKYARSTAPVSYNEDFLSPTIHNETEEGRAEVRAEMLPSYPYLVQHM